MEKYEWKVGELRREWRWQSVARHLFYGTRSYAQGETLAQLISRRVTNITCFSSRVSANAIVNLSSELFFAFTKLGVKP